MSQQAARMRLTRVCSSAPSWAGQTVVAFMRLFVGVPAGLIEQPPYPHGEG
jgi:hypothetical protein